MINYNTGVLYNAGIKGGGSNYNSGVFFIIEVSDSGIASEVLSLVANLNLTETGIGQDSIVDLVKFDTNVYLIVTDENILEPLGLYVLRDSQFELIPQTRDNTDEIPGRHGELDFGSEYKARNGTLRVATPEGLTPKQKEALKRVIARCLNPVAGEKKLVFLMDIEKSYTIKIGKIESKDYADWFEFEIPFKMSNPFIEGTILHTFTGSGIITNEGTFETGLIIEIAGPATNPSLTIGSNTLTYTGTIPSGKTLIIDTEAQTAKIDNQNVIGNYNGVFPMLPPGDTNVIANSNVTIKWHDRWI